MKTAEHATPADTARALTQIAVFACGCFWSKEYIFSRSPGVVATRVGYTGGHTANPTYQQVCTKTTGHAEAVEVSFDPALTSFTELAKLFFEIHDPTIDRTEGGQYRSAIFYRDEDQHAVARALIHQLEARGLQVATTLEPAGTFWPAEERHQGYCDARGFTPQIKRKTRFS